MKKRKILSLVLSVCLLIGLLPAQAAAAPGGTASYAVYVHGGTMTRDGTAVRSGTSLPAGTVLTVTLDEGSFPGRQFAYWAGGDGTQVPQKSFRLLVDRLTAFYPVFSDLRTLHRRRTLCPRGQRHRAEGVPFFPWRPYALYLYPAG